MTQYNTGSRRFGAFTGVFVPTFLSIVGVILYLRLGVIVGTAGVVNAIVIVLLAVSVTFATGMSLSSITTTMRIGAGGAYSIISKTLGLEVGGSVGIPLYLAQTLSVVLYIFGFAEIWQFLFPGHPQWIVAPVAAFFLFLLTFVDVKYAVWTQTGVFFITLLSLASVFGGGEWWTTPLQVPLSGTFADTGFWGVFALFFPAVTGLMAGVGMSGELTDPKRQIPRGVMSALGITSVIYIIAIIWIGYVASPATLTSDPLIMAELAFFSPIVVLGILAATFSSALTTLVAAPRVLQALGSNSIIPWNYWFAKTAQKAEPRNATFFTSAIILAITVVGSLESVAQVLTMFFLITYAMINIAVFIEQTVGLVSFRPTFKVHRFVPLYGAVASILFMFLINVIAGFVAIGFLFFTYLVLVQRELEARQGDVRSGLFRTISEWAARKVMRLPESTQHTWKPSFFIPVATTRTLLGNYPLIRSMTYPNGTMTVLGVNIADPDSMPEAEGISQSLVQQELRELPKLVEKFGEEGLFTAFSVISVEDYTNGICIALEAIEGQVFHPNILFLPFNPDRLPAQSLRRIFNTAAAETVGVVLFDRDTKVGLGAEEEVNVWIPASALDQDFYGDRIGDLALLLGYKLQRNWQGSLKLWMAVDSADTERLQRAETYLDQLVYEARFPAGTETRVVPSDMETALHEAPGSDIHLVPVEAGDVDTVTKLSAIEGKSFLFVADSGEEDVLA